MNMEQFQRPLIVVYYKLDFTGKRKKETSYWRNRFASMNRKSKYNMFYIYCLCLHYHAVSF